jgi:ribosomal protein S18 acetylase RimI-like enzyme
MENLEFRIAQAEDFEKIAKLHANSWKKAYKGIYTDNYLDKEVDTDRWNTWQKRFQQPADNQLVIMAELDHQLIGFACIYFQDDLIHGSLIDNLHVKYEFQGKGIGQQLLKEALKLIIAKTATQKMYLWVLKENKNAYQFYQKIGGKTAELKSHLCPDRFFYDCYRIVWDERNRLI